jgi:hypothetical protein
VIAAATRELVGGNRPASGSARPACGQIDAPPGWRGYLATGHLPSGAALRFIFRAITPPGRPRRFDARFLLARAEDLRERPRRFLPRRG